MRYVTRWSEGGNSLYRTAQITRTRTPLHLTLMDAWLAYGHAPMDWVTNWLQARDNFDLSRWFAWPCEAYTQRWHPWLNERQDEFTVEIDFDQLSPEYRTWLAAKEAEWDEGVETAQGEDTASLIGPA